MISTENLSTGFGGFEKQLRIRVFRHILRAGRIPAIGELADGFAMSAEEIRAGLQKLEQGHAVVLQPSGEILRAAPFWAAPTAFTVEHERISWWASCIWDALGVPAMLQIDARIVASCGCCGEDMSFNVHFAAPQMRQGVIHFAVPARRWYENIPFT
ncbi:MAG: organomercurial lyase [Candidatus Acidiferrales bacterium]